ncbi:MAG: glycosyltransferase family 2 protein [Helicobacteraceae bacterium]|jgi:glycosyltransferase involved in cell wall biosynthesis|nr:glycosyltransferase family 2 protein [Helicobacteraceae bacterium]
MLVSIIIPTYKRQNLLPRAIRSAQNQTYKNIEILICDDEKSGETKALVEAIAKEDSRVQYLENVRTKGVSGARNTGIYAAQGEFISLFDDDDEILAEAIETFIKLDLSQYSFAYAWHNRIYDNGKIKYPKNPPTINFEALAKSGSNIAGSMLFVSKKNLVAIKMFDETISGCEDYDLTLKLTKEFGDAICIEKALFNYYSAINRERVSNNIDKKYRGMRAIALKHAKNFSKQDRAKYLYRTRQYRYGEHLGRAFAWLSVRDALKELRHKIKRAIRRALKLRQG